MNDQRTQEALKENQHPQLLAAVKNDRHLLHPSQPGPTQTQRLPSSRHHPQVPKPQCRHHLKLCLSGREANIIVQDKEIGVKVDNKVRRSIKFPVGIMDTLSVVKTNEHYRLLYDVKGRFTLVKVKEAEAKFKLLKVTKKAVGPNKIPYIVTNDARTIRFPHPEIN